MSSDPAHLLSIRKSVILEHDTFTPHGYNIRAGGISHRSPRGLRSGGARKLLAELDITVDTVLRFTPEVDTRWRRWSSRGLRNFQIYRDGMTVAEYLAAGGLLRFLPTDVRRGLVSFVRPTTPGATVEHCAA